jgi:hypothetical protein
VRKNSSPLVVVSAGMSKGMLATIRAANQWARPKAAVSET